MIVLCLFAIVIIRVVELTPHPGHTHPFTMSNEKSLTTPKEKLDGRSFTFETMACVLAVLESKGATLSGKAYDLMAQLDGKRTTAAFQHQFRAVKTRAKELAAQLDGGAAVPRKRKGAKKSTSVVGKKRGST